MIVEVQRPVLSGRIKHLPDGRTKGPRVQVLRRTRRSQGPGARPTTSQSPLHVGCLPAFQGGHLSSLKTGGTAATPSLIDVRLSIQPVTLIKLGSYGIVCGGSHFREFLAAASKDNLDLHHPADDAFATGSSATKRHVPRLSERPGVAEKLRRGPGISRDLRFASRDTTQTSNLSRPGGKRCIKRRSLQGSRAPSRGSSCSLAKPKRGACVAVPAAVFFRVDPCNCPKL